MVRYYEKHRNICGSCLPPPKQGLLLRRYWKFCLWESFYSPKLLRSWAASVMPWCTFAFVLQAGCCKPPDSCGFQYQGPITWSKPQTPATTASQDCNAWSNDPSTLCYNCDSCKAGVLQNLKGDWKKVAVLNIIFLVFLIIVYSIGCCAFRNNRWDNANNRWKPYAWKPWFLSPCCV